MITRNIDRLKVLHKHGDIRDFEGNVLTFADVLEELRAELLQLWEERDQWKAMAERAYDESINDQVELLESENRALRDAVRHLRGQIPTFTAEDRQWGVTSTELKHETFRIHIANVTLCGVTYCYCDERWHRVGRGTE